MHKAPLVTSGSSIFIEKRPPPPPPSTLPACVKHVMIAMRYIFHFHVVHLNLCMPFVFLWSKSYIITFLPRDCMDREAGRWARYRQLFPGHCGDRGHFTYYRQSWRKEQQQVELVSRSKGKFIQNVSWRYGQTSGAYSINDFSYELR
jgi:hypothetical protein